MSQSSQKANEGSEQTVYDEGRIGKRIFDHVYSQDEEVQVDLPSPARKQARQEEEEIDDAFRNSSTKRNDYLSWDEYFMALAFLSSMRSKGS